MNDNNNIFVNGMIAKRPHERAPEFVKASISIKCEEFHAFMKENHKNGWLNIDIKESKGGKWYAQLNTFERNKQQAEPQQQEQSYDFNSNDFTGNDLAF